MNTITHSHPLAAVEALIPDINAAVDDIDQHRKLPAVLVRDLKAAGAFRALIPKQYLGLQAAFEDYIRLIQKLAAADASTAWCVNQSAVIGLTSLWLPDETIRKIWETPDTSVSNGPPFKCRIEPHEKGFRLNGHWGFSSGCQHATWMNGIAGYSEGGARLSYFRPDQVEFNDNWQVAGLRGTGSFEFRIKDLILPPEQVTDPSQPATAQVDVTQLPTTLLFAVSFACVALGIASAAIDDVLSIAQSKVPVFIKLGLRDDPDVQRFVGKAQARWRSANAYLHTTVAEVFEGIRRNGAITHDERSQLRMAGTQVILDSAKVVDMAYRIAGSTGIYQDQTLQRRFQDMHVITQHVQARELYFGMLGRYAITGKYEPGGMG
ncbi:MAG: acyl-CoA dehydrogenase family protein [Chloroflexota bacterium]